MVVNTGAKLVLIDSGSGPGSRQTGTGRLPDNLAAAGIDPKNIDVVIISHFHGDHISGLRTADGALAFANAEIMGHSEPTQTASRQSRTRRREMHNVGAEQSLDSSLQ